MGSPFYPSETDIVRLLPHVRFVPIPLQRSKIERRPDIKEEERPIPLRDVTPRDSTRQLKAIARPPPPRSLIIEAQPQRGVAADHDAALSAPARVS
jgi:hypothetical protein